MKRITAIISVLLILSVCLSLTACGKEAAIDNAVIKGNEFSVDLTFPGHVSRYALKVEFENHDPNALDGIIYYNSFRLAEFPNQTQTVDFSEGNGTFMYDNKFKFKGIEVKRSKDSDNSMQFSESGNDFDLKKTFGEDLTARCILLKDGEDILSKDVTFE